LCVCMQAIASKTKEFEATCATLKNKHKLDYNDQLDLEKKAEAATSAQPKKKAKKVIDVENGEESEDAHASREIRTHRSKRRGEMSSNARDGFIATLLNLTNLLCIKSNQLFLKL
jgi:hypothetical protein